MESQSQSFTDDAMSTPQRLSSDAHGPKFQTEGSISNPTPSNSACKLRF